MNLAQDFLSLKLSHTRQQHYRRNSTTFLQKMGKYHPLIEKAITFLPNVNKTNLIFLLLLILCWEGCTALAIILKPVFSFILRLLPIGNRWPKRNVPYLFSLKRGNKEMKDGELEKASKKTRNT
uniref:Uncharacterized protein n=1 Tax=Ditylenchus dipsaci TaxID=166011 RepID=A0A915DLX0_9BILA